MATDDFLPEDMGFFANRWWIVALRGIVAIAFGVLAFTWPAVTLRILVMLFGFYALVDGIFTLGAAIGGRRSREYRWLLVLEGIVTTWAGVITLRAPWMAATALVLFISIWAMATGFLRIAASFRLRKEISGEALLALSGVAAILFALILMFRPAAGAIGLIWVIGGYAVVLGVLQIMLGSELLYFRRLLSH